MGVDIMKTCGNCGNIKCRCADCVCLTEEVCNGISKPYCDLYSDFCESIINCREFYTPIICDKRIESEV